MLFGTTSRIPLVGLACLFGVVLVVAGNAMTSLVAGRPIVGAGTFGAIDAPDVAVLHFVTTATPLLLLGLLNVRRLRFWLLAIVLGAAFWCYAAWQIWQDSLTGFAGGANIGLGLIMLASPFVIVACLGLARLISGPKKGCAVPEQ